MSGLLGVVIFVLSLLASIGLHELGHMLPAKRFGVRVSQYMIGFGPTLWSKSKGDTEYGLKAIPLGGYVRIVGMFGPRKKPLVEGEEGTFTSLIEGARAASLQEIREGEEDRAFYLLSAPKKFIVMFGGPFTNFLIACVLISIANVGLGLSTPTTTIAKVVDCVPTTANPEGILSTDNSCGSGLFSPAYSAGLKPGDQLVSVNGVTLTDWLSLGTVIDPLAGKRATIQILRDGEKQSLSIKLARREIPVYDEQGNDTGKKETVGFVGIRPQNATERRNILEMPGYIYGQVKTTLRALLSFPKATLSMSETLVTSKPRDENGPISVVGISQVSGQIATEDSVAISDKIYAFLMLIASINMFLFIFNLVPVLPLDGGHIAGAIYEGIRKQLARLRKKPDPGPVDTARMMPMALLMGVFLISIAVLSILLDLIKPISF